MRTAIAVTVLALTAPHGDARSSGGEPPPFAPFTGSIEMVDVAPVVHPIDSELRKHQDELRPGRCELQGGYSVELYFLPDTPRVDGTLIIRKGEEDTLSITPEPKTPLRGNIGGGGYTLACDPEAQRFYYGHPVLGYVVAYDIDGRELWRHELDGFSRMEMSGETTASDVLKQLLRDRSLLMMVVCRDGLVLVVERNGNTGAMSTWLDRSGAEIATLGPWDGFLYEVADGHWTFLARGGVDPPYRTPPRLVKVRVGGD